MRKVAPVEKELFRKQLCSSFGSGKGYWKQGYPEGSEERRDRRDEISVGNGRKTVY